MYELSLLFILHDHYLLLAVYSSPSFIVYNSSLSIVIQDYQLLFNSMQYNSLLFMMVEGNFR